MPNFERQNIVLANVYSHIFRHFDSANSFYSCQWHISHDFACDFANRSASAQQDTIPKHFGSTEIVNVLDRVHRHKVQHLSCCL